MLVDRPPRSQTDTVYTPGRGHGEKPCGWHAQKVGGILAITDSLVNDILKTYALQILNWLLTGVHSSSISVHDL